MLDQLTIKGFKSIRELTGLDLFAINVLVGGNGAGKSNLIEFFKMLRAMQGFRLAEFGVYKPSLSKFLENKGGLQNFLFGGAQTTQEIQAELKLKNGETGYRFAIGLTADASYSITREQFYCEGDSKSDCWLPKDDECAFRKESSLPESVSEDLVAKRTTRNKEIYDAIRSWQIYQFHDTSQLAAARLPSFVYDADEFHFDGGNLAAFLYSLKNGCSGVDVERCRESYAQIVDTIRLAAPYFKNFVLEPFKEGDDEKVRLQWLQTDMLMKFQPHHISDGTLRFMCLATVLLQPQPPELIIIDEPELGLHPEALEVLAELIRRCSSRTQFILATQSPSFADFFEPEEVLTVNRVNGASVFERQSRERLGKWLESYSIGQLWRKNVIKGGVTNG
jgi:predicted ATPase